jgi:hypothetical protein
LGIFKGHIKNALCEAQYSTQRTENAEDYDGWTILLTGDWIRERLVGKSTKFIVKIGKEIDVTVIFS